MDLEDAAREAGTGERGLRFVDDDGAAVASFPAGENDTAGGTAEMEILRGELSRLLYERTRERTDYRFGEQIRALTDHGDRVTARLASGEELDADVVVVAEGTRSRTRAARDARRRAHRARPPDRPPDHPAHGRRRPLVALAQRVRVAQHGLRPDNLGTTRAMLAFLTDVRGLEALDRDDQVAILRRTYADVGWQAPRVLDALDGRRCTSTPSPRCRLPRWSAGRTVLLGDAAWATGPSAWGRASRWSARTSWPASVRGGQDTAWPWPATRS